MFQIRKKKEVTFKTKVDKFWRWFSKNAARFKDVIDDDRCGDLLDETSKAVNALGDFGWCYGPGKEEGRHAFTLTPEGIRDRQYLTQYWISRCPDIPDWDFYSAKPGRELSDKQVIKTAGFDFAAGEIWVSCEPDDEYKDVDISIWHPHFSEIDEDETFRITYIFLDELIGEYDVENWIGRISFNKEKFENAIPLMELVEYLDNLRQEKGWEKGVPYDSWRVYQREPQEDGFLRSDVFIGMALYSAHPGAWGAGISDSGDYLLFRHEYLF